MNQFFFDRAYQQAIDRFSELLTIYPNNVDLLRYYSFALRTVGRVERALELTNRILELDTLNAQDYGDRGTLYRSLGRWEEALESFRKAESLGLPRATDLAALALFQNDHEALAMQLEGGILEWRGLAMWYPIYQASQAKLDDNTQSIRTILEPGDKEEGVTSWLNQSYYPLLLGDAERAINYYSNALDNLEPMALRGALGGIGERKTYPEFYNHPKYFEMLQANGLDSASVAKLSIPPFPF